MAARHLLRRAPQPTHPALCTPGRSPAPVRAASAPRYSRHPVMARDRLARDRLAERRVVMEIVFVREDEGEETQWRACRASH